MGRRLLVPLLLFFQILIVAALVGWRWGIVSGGEHILLPAVVEAVSPDRKRPEVTLRYRLNSVSVDRLGGRRVRVGERIPVPVDDQGGGGGRGQGSLTGVVVRAGELSSSWEVVIQSLEGTRSIFSPAWFGFREGDLVYGCVDVRGNLLHVDRLESGGGCWNKEWRRIEGRVVTARESRGERVELRYGIERFHPPTGVRIPPPGSEVMVEVATRWGFAAVVRLLPPTP